MIILLVFCAICLLGGGSSRPDAHSLLLVRLAAIGAGATTLILLPPFAVKPLATALVFPGLALLLMCIQLVPLPPGIWAALPGHARYVPDAALGIAPVWRPISLTPDLTLNAILALIPPVVAVIGMMASGRAGRIWTVRAFAVFAMFGAVLGLAQLAGGPASPLRLYAITNFSSPVGFFANRNHQALFLACGIPMIATWLSSIEGSPGRQRVFAAIAFAAVMFLLMVILETGSRSGLIFAGIGTGGALALYLRTRILPIVRRQSSEPRNRWLLTGGMAAFVLAAIVPLALRSSAVARLLATDPVDEQRTAWLRPLIEMTRSFMPFGAGFGSFDSIYRNFEPFDLLQLTYLNAAHDDLLQLAIEGGVGGLALLVAFLVWWAPRFWRLWRTAERSGAVRTGQLGGLVTLVMMLASLADYPLRTPLLAVLFAVACMWMRGGVSDTQPGKSGPGRFTPTA